MNRFIKILLICLTFNKIIAEINIYSKEKNEYFSHGYGIHESADDNENMNSVEVLVRKKREEDICDTVTCKNEGKCIKLKDGGFICACKSGYRGAYCDKSTRDCTWAPCKAVVHCMKLGENKGTVCICVDPTESTFCTLKYLKTYKALDGRCSLSNCLGAGECSHVHNHEALCVCPPGYSGNCQNEFFSLLETTRADCMETDYGHVCICSEVPGSPPFLCARQPFISKAEDPCIPNPCKNWGICRIATHSYKIDYQCACPLGFTGKTCSEPIGSCASMGCRQIEDCVSSPAGGICNCMGDMNGHLCKLSLGKESSWDKMKNVASEDDLHTAETVLGIIVAIIALVFIFLAIHCKRVNSRRSEIHQEYMGLLKKRVTPGSLPPDWMTISSHLLKQTLCCAKSKLNTDFTPKKSSSRQSQQSGGNDQERKEEALIALLNSKTDVQRSDSGHMSKHKETSFSQEGDEEDAVEENLRLHPHKEPHLRRHSSQNLSRNAYDGIEPKTNIDPYTVYDYLKSKRRRVKQAGDSMMWKRNSDKRLKMSTAQGPINVIKKAGRHINSSMSKAKPYLKQLVNVPRKYPRVLSSVSESDEEERLISRRYPSYNNSALNRNVNTNYGSSDEEDLGCNYNYPKEDEYLSKHFPSPDAKYNVCRNNINSEYTKSNMRQASRLVYTDGSPPSTAIVREIKTESYNQRTNKAIPHNMSEKAHEYIKYLSYNPADDCGSNRKSDLQNDPYDTIERAKYEDFEVLKASVHVSRNNTASFNNRDENQESNTTRAKGESEINSPYSNTTGAKGMFLMKSHYTDMNRNQGYSGNSVKEYGVWSMTVQIPANEFEEDADGSWKIDKALQEKNAEVNYDQNDLLFKDKNNRKKEFSNISSNNNQTDFHKQTMREEHKKKTNDTHIVTAGDCTSDAGSDDFKHIKCFKEGGRKLYYVSNSRREIHSSQSTADDSVEWKYDEDGYNVVAGNTEDTSGYEQSSESASTSESESYSLGKLSEKNTCTESSASSSSSTSSSFSTSSPALTSDSSSPEMAKPSSVNQNEVSVSIERNGVYVPAGFCNSYESPLPYLSMTNTQSMDESEDCKNADDLTRETYFYEIEKQMKNLDAVGNISSSLRIPPSRQTSTYQNNKETHIWEDEVGIQKLNQTSFNDKHKEDDVNVPVTTVSPRCKHSYTPYTHLEQMLITDAKDYSFNCSNHMELSPSDDRGQYVETDISHTKPSPDHREECGKTNTTYICSSSKERRQLENMEPSCTNVPPSLTQSFMSESDSSQTLVASDQSFSSLWSLTDATLVPAEDDSGSDSEEIWM